MTSIPTHPAARRGRLLLLAGALAAVFSSAGARGATEELIKLDAAQRSRAGVQTVAVGAAPAQDGATSGQQLAGTVVAAPEGTAVLSSIVGGVIQQVHVSPLQDVRTNTPVVTLFSQQLVEWQRDYLQLATQATLTKQKLARDEALFADGLIARSRLEESRAAAMQASVMASERRQALRAAGMGQAQLQRLQEQQAMSPALTLTAGAAGTLLELPLSPGQRVEAGVPLARIAKSGALWLELQASPQLAAQLRVGDAVQVAGCGAARVRALSPQLDAGNQSVLVLARMEGGDACLKLNQYVQATVAAKPAGGVQLPSSALVRRGAASFVFVQRSTGFAAVPVTAAPAGADAMWVQGALPAGSQVAVRGVAAIKGAWLGLGAEGDK
ncbi:efflux RND transporter periplasmic adaptor subunit [Rugamonas apoptosis]|uniref:Efflux RND transporter periplasmic adaptor subunit n=1 Tax=Rugamonas apoptosis TaxID=2758570 RepID=A0A7W2IKQ9_9BURK|nr:efflux RND transporter periplasmic adaptor subunit [Rugamonas apoptosis]MBA5687828.1 efflux RND transporter periplasmic adaptor subunit [Rugamonas apoptosis]